MLAIICGGVRNLLSTALKIVSTTDEKAQNCALMVLKQPSSALMNLPQGPSPSDAVKSAAILSQHQSPPDVPLK